jgi:hypothetical protein
MIATRQNGLMRGRLRRPTRRLRVLAGLACLLGAAGPGRVAAQGVGARHPADPAPVNCRIEETQVGAELLLQGKVAGDMSAEGQYRLLVSKVGQAGTSNISQGGAFKLEPGADIGLGRINLSLERGAQYEATLTVTVDDRTFVCRVSGAAPSDL